MPVSWRQLLTEFMPTAVSVSGSEISVTSQNARSDSAASEVTPLSTTIFVASART